MPNTPGIGLPNPANYAAGVTLVVDTVTQLRWERTVSSSSYTQADAQTYCAGLTLGGQTGWRLPSVLELVSITDDSRSLPAIDPVAFPSTPSEDFWTSSPLASAPSVAAWMVNFGGGAPSQSYDLSEMHRVRCVR
jgi:hypothetical protein